MANIQRPYTYKQQARTITKGSHIVIAGRPCKVALVRYSETTKRDYTNCTFVAHDIFDGTERTHNCRSHLDCLVPVVYDKFYKIIRISRDGHLLLRPEYGLDKNNFILPPGPPTPPPNRGDGDFLTQIRDRVRDGISMGVSVKSAMGEECIVGVIELDTQRLALDDYIMI
ncbi:eukaryotic translation initiation factor 5A [Artemisia annua]|uniref:Eukaryotic translation initiation factor 5A n=1 Tax=Artemisia annua TaxID=35608 RepID=A0A2U1M691_ARTAN|nr:eukaryotic translation initiation factor 5A [Artemisia annua]